MILSLVLSTLAFATPQTTGVSPDIFLGSYKLTATHAGSCDSQIEPFASETVPGQVDYDIGTGFLFTAVNAGTQTSDDNLMKIVSNSYTTSDSRLVGDRTMVTKASGERSVTHREAILRGNTLHLVEHNTQTSPTEGSYAIDTDCTYERVNSEK